MKKTRQSIFKVILLGIILVLGSAFVFSGQEDQTISIESYLQTIEKLHKSHKSFNSVSLSE